LLRGLAIFFVLMNHVNMRLLIAKIPYTAKIPALLVPVTGLERSVSAFRFSLPSQASLSLRQHFDNTSTSLRQHFDAADRWPA
jgi:hypothetical protein